MEKEYVVKLDVYLGILEARVISFNQLNTGTCKLSFELTSNKQALDLTGKKVTFEVTTPSGATLEDAILITDATQGKCECMLANDMIAEQGLHCGEINVYSADHAKMLTFKKFMYLVNGQLGAKDITVDTRYSTLQELIFDVENLKNQSVIDTEAVAQMKNETDLMHKEVIVKHGDVEVKHQEVVTLAQSVKDDASRTGSNAQQVSTDKGIVTKAKNEVVAKHDEVLKTAGVIAQDKVIVEQAKTETLGYKNDVEAMKNDVQQLVTDSTEDLILEGNRQVVRVSTEGTTQVDLAKAEVTKATQQATVATEQATIATAKSEEATTQADRATREADRAGAQAQEKVNNKIGLNGVHDDTIFNFIGDKGNAIKELHATDSTGKTSILKLGSDEDHVEMASGRTLREEYMGVLKTMGKEFVSPDGSPVEVNNGIEARVISAEIKGQTVKNLFPTNNNIVTQQSMFSSIISQCQRLTPSTKYVFGVFVTKFTEQSKLSFKLNTANDVLSEYVEIPITKLGLNYIEKVVNSTSEKLGTVMIPSTGWGVEAKKFEFKNVYIADGVLYDNPQFGLNSTQAIIANNGQQYPIYATEEDKVNKKVISLGGVGDVQDTLEIKDDGSVVYTQNTKEIVLDNNINCTLTNSYSSENHLFFNITVQDIKMISDYRLQGIMCDKFKWEEFASFALKDYEFICGNKESAKVGIKIAKTKLESPTVEGFKKWLQANPVTVRYQLASPIVTNIPKELVPTILTNQTNILEVGGAVKPSSFKVTLPVDRIAELTARLEAVEAKTNTQPVNTAFVDETYAKSVNKIEEVIK